jgi:GNAT superfamily N-acetyltransferase
MPPVLTADWTGRRIVVRRVVRGPVAANSAYQDVLGDLIALDDGALTIETRTGRVEVARSDVASARLVVPAAREVLALEMTSARGWRAQEVETSSDGWLLRADLGWTGRANSALALRTVRRSLDEVLAEVTAWYAERGLPPRIQIPQPAADRADNALSNALARRGWTGADHTDVLVSRLDLLAGRTRQPSDGNPAGDPSDDTRAVNVRLDARPDDAWLAAYHYRGGGPLPPGAADLLSRHDHVTFARVELDGAVVAIGRGAVDDGWLGITALDVNASYRRLGLATAVVGALGRWATSGGAVRAYVQTDQANDSAQRFFPGLGFFRHHSYLYRSAPTIN